MIQLDLQAYHSSFFHKYFWPSSSLLKIQVGWLPFAQSNGLCIVHSHYICIWLLVWTAPALDCSTISDYLSMLAPSMPVAYIPQVNVLSSLCLCSTAWSALRTNASFITYSPKVTLLPFVSNSTNLLTYPSNFWSPSSSNSSPPARTRWAAPCLSSLAQSSLRFRRCSTFPASISWRGCCSLEADFSRFRCWLDR